MYNIILLSSFHLSMGKCNYQELYKIIEKIHPEIIFEELSIDTFSYVYAEGSTPNTIEAIAIKKYLKNHPIKHFPVDNYPINESDLFSGADEISKKSNEYIKLWNVLASKIKEKGYDFLNSNANIELLDKIHNVEKSILLKLNDEKLSYEFNSEIEFHNKREYEMLRNIYNYSQQYPYKKAVFICGAEHRKPLKLKIHEYENTVGIKLNWIFYNDK